MRTSLSATIALSLAAALSLSACGTQTTPSASTSSSTASSSTSSTEQPDSALVLEDGWVKATTEAMTGVFGTLKNTSDAAITVNGGAADVAGKVETHITVKENGAMVMKRTTRGFTIEPGGTFELKPGANHIMLMGLKGPIKAGDPLRLTLRATNGTTYDVTAVGREFTGAQETYAPEQEDMGESSSMTSSHS